MAWQLHYGRGKILRDPMTDLPKLFATKAEAKAFADLSGDNYSDVVLKEVK